MSECDVYHTKYRYFYVIAPKSTDPGTLPARIRAKYGPLRPWKSLSESKSFLILDDSDIESEIAKNGYAVHHKHKHSLAEEVFESFLFNSRFLVLFAVFGSLAASLTLFCKGIVEIVQGVGYFCSVMPNFHFTHEDDKKVILAFIPAIDNYLFATVLLIFSMGIYELFISKIDPDIATAVFPAGVVEHSKPR